MTRKRMKVPERRETLSDELRFARSTKGASAKIEVSIPNIDRWISRAVELESEVARLLGIVKATKEKNA